MIGGPRRANASGGVLVSLSKQTEQKHTKKHLTTLPGCAMLYREVVSVDGFYRHWRICNLKWRNLYGKGRYSV